MTQHLENLMHGFNNNNNEYLERLTRIGPKHLHVLYKYIMYLYRIYIYIAHSQANNRTQTQLTTNYKQLEGRRVAFPYSAR